MRIAFKNFTDTLTSFLRNDATAQRIWQLQDRDGTLVDLTDLVASNINEITGAEVLTSADFNKVHILSGTSADYTVTLPSGIGHHGKMIFFKGHEAPGTFNKAVTIEDDGVDTVVSKKITTRGYMALIVIESGGQARYDTLSYEQGNWLSWSPTLVGWSVAPTLNAHYKRSISHLDLSFVPTAHGTSNTTTMTFTLPESLVPAASGYQLGLATNNGASVTGAGVVAFTISNNIVTCYLTLAFGAWTASNGKSIGGIWRVFI